MPAPFRRHVLWLLCVVFVGCGTPGPRGPADSFGLDFTMPPDAVVNGALIFVVDGVNADIFQRMLEAGELPAFKKYFVDRGLYAPRAVASVPSVTLACLTSIATGKLPGEHGIVGINWFDRNTLIWRNYETIAQKNTLDGDYDTLTMFDHFRDRTTFSVFFQPHKGTTKFIENWTSAGPPYFFGWYEFVDRLTLHRLGIVAEVARTRKEWPAVTVAYLLAPDFRSYEHGVAGDEYRQALKHTDYQVGRVLGDLERAGLLDKLLIAMVSDHGHVDVVRHRPIRKLLDQWGLDMPDKRPWEKTPFEQRLEYYQGFAVEQFGSGDRYAAIHLRQPIWDGQRIVGYQPWLQRPSAKALSCYPTHGPAELEPTLCRRLLNPPGKLQQLDLLTMLAAEPAVDLLAYRADDGAVRLRNAQGEVEFAWAGPASAAADPQSGMEVRPPHVRSLISYRVVSGDDPLGWHDKLPSWGGQGLTMTGRDWLRETIDTRYPDLPEQILTHFQASLAGDIVLFASKGWDFGEQHKGGHGGLSEGDMLVPILLAGPGVPHGKVDVARQVDLAATVLDLLGKRWPSGQTAVPLHRQN